MKELTHILSATPEFPDYFDAISTFVNIINPSWVAESLRRNRQMNPRQFSPDPALFMSDFTVYCADIPEGDVEAIHGAVVALGGVASSTLSKAVTHLVALDYGHPQCETAISRGLSCKIILPHW
jgi:hypothetical protein